MRQAAGPRPWTFYVFASFFALFVLFLYGPMTVIYILSFQGPTGGLTFPMTGFSFRWFHALVTAERVGDIGGSFQRSIVLVVFYLAIASLIMPGLFVGLGIAVGFQLLGLDIDWYTSALGAQLTWTLPYGLLIMFAVLGRFNRAYEEAATDLGATPWERMREVVLPILLPGIIGVALFGFTLSYDEFPRTVLTVGTRNTLPLEIWAMTTNVTSPALFAVGTVTTIVSFIAIGAALISIAVIQRRRTRGSGNSV